MNTPETQSGSSLDRLVRPRVVCLCGSTRFRDGFEAANREATLEGSIVLAPGVFGHADAFTPTPEERADLDALHLRKIDMADVVWVIATGGYIGDSTRLEIEYAGRHGKPVVYWPNDRGQR
jgi:hypothetical protein